MRLHCLYNQGYRETLHAQLLLLHDAVVEQLMATSTEELTRCDDSRALIAFEGPLKTTIDALERLDATFKQHGV